MVSENDEERRKRRRQRQLFDGVAERYDDSRRSYPKEFIDSLVATANLRSGSAVLEVGCGTGQLTEQLAAYGFDLTAIDIGPSMVAVARRRLAGTAASFHVVSFEAFEAEEGSFDLIISATAWHWVDPEVRPDKAARLLRPGGWLALLSTGERHDDPFGPKLLEMWVERATDGGAWVRQQKLSGTEIVAGTGLFDVPLERASAESIVLTGRGRDRRRDDEGDLPELARRGASGLHRRTARPSRRPDRGRSPTGSDADDPSAASSSLTAAL